jgi:hypothetical protein
MLIYEINKKIATFFIANKLYKKTDILISRQAGMPDPRKTYALPAYSIILAGGPPSPANTQKDALSLEDFHLDPRNLAGLLRYLG